MNIKKTLLGTMSLLTAVIYLLSTIGFDIHRDTDCGRTWVRLLSENNSCAAIHPGHHHSECSLCGHSHSGCCHCHEDGCNGAEGGDGYTDEGCTNSAEVLTAAAQTSERLAVHATVIAVPVALLQAGKMPKNRFQSGIFILRHSAGPPVSGRETLLECCVSRA